MSAFTQQDRFWEGLSQYPGVGICDLACEHHDVEHPQGSPNGPVF